VPTGVALRDARRQLFDAAERVLLRDGPRALTSRAVTTEAGVAKGVLHQHFADFDAFLAELVEDRVAWIGARAARLRDSTGTGSVVANLTGALTDLLGSVAVAIIPLIIFRDELRTRLRQARPAGGLPILSEAAAMIAAYLTAEQGAGRIAPDADIDTLALALIGAEHLLYADSGGLPPEPAAIGQVVGTVLAGVLRDPECRRPHAG
jgi:AcrR family transcriptional regulator